MNPVAVIKNEELTHELWKKGKAQAIAEKEWVISDHQRLIVLQTIALTFKGESAASAERKARVSQEYSEHIQKMGKLRQDVIIARAAYAAVDHEIRMRINKSFQQREEFKAGSINT